MDIEKAMQFIVGYQAKFEAKMAAFHEKFSAEMEELRKRQGRHSEADQRLCQGRSGAD